MPFAGYKARQSRSATGGSQAGASPLCDKCQATASKIPRRPLTFPAAAKAADSSLSAGAIASALGPGAALDPRLRKRYEPQLGRSLADVRIHSGDRAASSASALGARAYTFGSDIVFNRDRFAPHTEQGGRLLAHELTHVAQQRASARTATSLRVSQPSDRAEREADRATPALIAGRPIALGRGTEPVGIYRAPETATAPTPAPAPAAAAPTPAPANRVTPTPAPSAAAPAAAAPITAAVAPEALILKWLDTHQFAPPREQQGIGQPKEKQPTPDQLHLLLNGEEMTVAEATKLAVDGMAKMGQPQTAAVVQGVIVNALSRPMAKSTADLPFVGPRNEVPGINLGIGGRKDAFGISPAIAITVEQSSIDDYLEQHQFSPPAIRDPIGDKVSFDGNDTTVEAVAAKAYGILPLPVMKPADVLTYVRQKYAAARISTKNQILFGYTLIPKFSQYVSGPKDPLNPLRTQHQFSFTFTRQFHENDSPGLELSAVGSVTFTEDGILNIQAGPQLAWVKPLFDGLVQVSGLVQVMAANNWNKTANGTMTLAPGLQEVAGGQIVLTPSAPGGPYKLIGGTLQLNQVQIGIQALGGAQETGGTTTAVFNAGLVISIPLNF